MKIKMKIETCPFVRLSDLMAEVETLRLSFDETEHDVSFGDANRTLVSLGVFQEMLRNVDEEKVSDEDNALMKSYMEELKNCSALIYIDLEN